MKYARYEEFSLSGGGFVNLRSKPEKAKLVELAQDIRARGLEMPLTVWRGGEELVIISGSRRYTAIGMLIDNDEAGDLGDKIPYKIFEGTLADARLEAFVSNLHREDLTAFEMASEIYELTENAGLDQKEIAARLRKSQPWVSILLTSYKQSGKALKKAWKSGALPLNTVYDLSSLDEGDQQAAVDEQLAARAGGGKAEAGKAGRAARVAAGKSDCPSKKQIQSYLELTAGCKEGSDTFVAGMRAFGMWVTGQIGVGEFGKPWNKWMATRREVAEEVDGEEFLNADD